MNLYLISQDVNNDYDTYDSAVVAAKSEDEAKQLHPRGNDEKVSEFDGMGGSTWAAIENVQCIKIGTAVKGTKQGVILASFNAG